MVTTIEPAQPFYSAEEYHQDFYKGSLPDDDRRSRRPPGFIDQHWKGVSGK
uniref:peptide-methionine (S)-S-oxide reductase n=1 Tax=Phytohabitans flavus TaxID=1076124 RepID=UPI00366EE31E